MNESYYEDTFRMWRGVFQKEEDEKSEENREYEEKRYKRNDRGN